MAAVFTVLNKPIDWPSIKKEMTDPKFMEKIQNLNKDNLSENVIKRVEAFTKKDNFTPAVMKRQSEVAEKLCLWVRAVEDYHKALKVVRPKQEKRDAALAKVAALEADLKAMQDEFAELERVLKENQAHLDETSRLMEEYKASLEQLQVKIDRGEKLVSSLSDEKISWEGQLEDLREQDHNLPGNALLSAAFMSLNGPFPADFRERLMDKWKKRIRQLSLPHDRDF